MVRARDDGGLDEDRGLAAPWGIERVGSKGNRRSRCGLHILGYIHWSTKKVEDTSQTCFVILGALTLGFLLSNITTSFCYQTTRRAKEQPCLGAKRSIEESPDPEAANPQQFCPGCIRVRSGECAERDLSCYRLD